ncbi:MAG: ppk [Verrucomicrobiales bacterium]|nr:ppk [Verrucomicrobiales bacterium]
MAKTVLGPQHFINRELSWLEFNKRVLDESLNPLVPLLERVKFFCIFSTNLDEFFEVRVAGLKQQMESVLLERSIDGLTASETLQAITTKTRDLVETQYSCWTKELRPALARHNICFFDVSQLNDEDKAWVENYYRALVRPVLTPLGLDPAHPFPQLLNKSLNLIVQLELTQNGETKERLAVVQVPRVLPRLAKLPRKSKAHHHYLFLADLIGHYLEDIFPGTLIKGHWHFRVTRNSELYIDEGDTLNLLEAVEEELHNRRKGDAVRLEVEKDCPASIWSKLLENFSLEENDLYLIDGPLSPGRLMSILDGEHPSELRDPPYIAPVTPALQHETDIFAAVRQRDILLHHPYETFGTVVEFLNQAAHDPNVLAIKQTLYRTGGDMRIVGALMEAVRNGKQVTAVVELKARFDEANNILWSQKLEEAGVHVVFGLVGYKIHGKMTLVVRRDEDIIRRYLHLSSGNYNPTTSRIYTDIGLLTCRPDFGEDASNLFNLLTGICQFQGTLKFLVAPFDLHKKIISLINREALNSEKGIPSRIIAKMNALVDREVIEALYQASQSGVKIDLIVRGVCCLRPGVKGISENITVRSIVDRFLEHSRIFYFENGAQPDLFIGSADWMPRNFHRRIEVVVPIEDGNLRDRIIHDVLEVTLEDNVKARMLASNGTYAMRAVKKGTPPRRSQLDFIDATLQAARPQKISGKSKEKYVRTRLAPRPKQLKNKRDERA